METRWLHYADAKSDKFWTISLQGNSHTVQYGRTGSAGQTQTKEFASPAEAKRAYDRLIQDKLKKGYVEAESPPTTPPLPIQPEVEASPEALTAAPAIAPTAELSSALVPAPALSRLALEPEDWRWATWRPHQPQPRPSPAPFDQQQALTRLARVCFESYQWNWSRANIAPSLSRPEAQFWLTAMLEANSVNVAGRFARRASPLDLTAELSTDGTLSVLVPKLAEREFTGEVALGDLRHFLEARDLLQAEQTLPLACLLTPQQWLEILLDLSAKPGRQLFGLVRGFQRQVLPCLAAAEVEALRQQVRPQLALAQWPTDYYHVPAVVFHLAACLGLHTQLQTLVESWPDSLYQFASWCDHYHQPQQIVFGLGDPEQVVRQMRRLKLKLNSPDYVRAWLAHTEYAELDFVRDNILAESNKESALTLLAVLARVESPEIAPCMLQLMLTSKAAQLARQWLTEHPEQVIAGLAPRLTERGQLAKAALDYLRGLNRKGYTALIQSYAEGASTEIADKIRSEVLENSEPLQPTLEDSTTPDWLQAELARVQALPRAPKTSWIQATDLPPLSLGQHCLNPSQVQLVLQALRHSLLTSPQPLLAALKQHCPPEGLDRFAWSLFETWLSEGAPAREKWAMAALGLLGSNASVLKLTPLIRAWPGESQHQRAVLGLECLRAIGTDTALMQINGIAQKLKFKGLKAKAQECLEAVAQERGLSRERLEDRIVPDCGLDEQGSRLFEFGSRQFHLVLGPELKPLVRDHAGQLKPDLPKPNRKDDPALAQPALADWKLLKKQIAEVAKIQAVRLEQAMVTGRRWFGDEFELLLVAHPLLTHLVQRLLWVGYNSANRPVVTFRVTEDRTYADLEDQAMSLEAVAEVGLVHPLRLSAELTAAWGKLFSDYQIMPPFAQLSRPVYHLEPGEAQAREITRWREVAIPPMALVGTLEKLNWARGIPEDAGVYHEHSKVFAQANLTAVIEYEGIPIGYGADWDHQKLERCFFLRGIYTPQMYPNHQQSIALGEVDPVVLSEVLRDLAELASQAG